jgi:SynChlorMet cassette radical SAM/SPASM protein ScmF
MSAEAPELTRLYVYLTEGCNLACRHCWLSPRFDADASHTPTLPVELFEQALREALPLGLTGVKLTGGEPLLHPRIADILEIARTRELSLNMETNGVLMTPALAKEIARFPDRFVSVSLDGADAATHEEVRGVKGSFDAACRAVRLLADSGTSPQIIMSLLAANTSAGQIERMVRLAGKLGASSLKFNVIQPTGRGESVHRRDETVGVEEVIRLGRWVERELAAKTGLRLCFDYPPAFRPLGRIAGAGGSEVCGIFGILGLLATGEYALCGIGTHVPELIFGTAGKDSLEKVWRGHPVLQDLRSGLPDRLEGVCGRCLMRSLCLGSCVAQNYYRAGRVWAPFWFCRAAEEAGLFPESRLGTEKDRL